MSTAPPALPFAKGHGTQNDFVLIPDADGQLRLPAARVAALCDRRAGIGGDGLIRVVRAAALGAAGDLPGPVPAGPRTPAEWFMDYRNSDGSIAEMCGNGLRVFVAYLEHLGWAKLREGEELAVATRAGVKRVRRIDGALSADLGPWRVVGGSAAAAAGADVAVTVPRHRPGLPGLVGLPGLSIDVGNPHVVVALPDLDRLAAADLRAAPVVDPAPVNGTNVELIVPMHDATRSAGHLTMRVHERGSGETRSCGTGAVAAVLAARVWAGQQAPDRWDVDVPGGRLRVSVPGDELLSGTQVHLAGPAVIVAEGRADTAALGG